MKMFDATEVVPVNFVFFTASAIVAGMSSGFDSQMFYSQTFYYPEVKS